MVTTSDNIRTSDFDEDPKLKEMFRLLERARDAHQDMQQAAALRTLSEKAKAYADEIDRHG